MPFGPWRALLGAAVSILFLALLARQVDVPKVVASIASTDYALLLAAVPFYFAGVWFRALRWQQFLLPLARLRAPGLFVQVVIGYMANDVLPLRVGELVRAYLLGRKHALAKSAVLGTIALERLTDGLTLLAFAGVIALFVPLEGWMGLVVRSMAVLFLGAAAGTLRVRLLRDRLGGRGPYPDPLPEGEGRDRGAPKGGGVRTGIAVPVLRIAGSFLGGTEGLRRPRLVATAGLHAVLAWLFEAAVFYVVGLAVGLSLPLWLYLLAMALANLATALPSSQAGIGPFEYFAAQTLILFGTDPSVAASYALLVHAVLILPVTLAGFLLLWREQISFRQLTATLAAGEGRTPPSALGART